MVRIATVPATTRIRHASRVSRPSCSVGQTFRSIDGAEGRQPKLKSASLDLTECRIMPIDNQLVQQVRAAANRQRNFFHVPGQDTGVPGTTLTRDIDVEIGRSKFEPRLFNNQ